MTDVAKPTTAMLDNVNIGISAATFRIYATQIEAVAVNPLLNRTGDGDASLQWAGPGNAYCQHTLNISGWIVGGAGNVIGFANLGADDNGVAVTVTIASGHTFACTLVLETIRYVIKKASQAVPLAFRGKTTGTITEANP